MAALAGRGGSGSGAHHTALWLASDAAHPKGWGSRIAYLTFEMLGVVLEPRGRGTEEQQVLEDVRLRLEKNASERALRPVAAARKSWLFFGSDDHASAAANLFSLAASCKLHGLDPESYLADVNRVMKYWPRARYLKLAPQYWAETRGRVDASELARPHGHVTVPPPRATEEQTAAD